jgi:hypothetical protein
MSKQETVEVTLKLPKGIVEFLKDSETAMEMTVEEYLTYTIIQGIGADIDTSMVFVRTPTQIIKQYSLEKPLKECNALPY